VIHGHAPSPTRHHDAPRSADDTIRGYARTTTWSTHHRLARGTTATLIIARILAALSPRRHGGSLGLNGTLPSSPGELRLLLLEQLQFQLLLSLEIGHTGRPRNWGASAQTGKAGHASTTLLLEQSSQEQILTWIAGWRSPGRSSTGRDSDAGGQSLRRKTTLKTTKLLQQSLLTKLLTERVGPRNAAGSSQTAETAETGQTGESGSSTAKEGGEGRLLLLLGRSE
jgi:hypothetical protein